MQIASLDPIEAGASASLTIECSVSLDLSTYLERREIPGICPLQLVAAGASAGDVAKFPARLACSDGYALFSWVKSLWSCKIQDLLRKDGSLASGIVLETGINVSQELLSSAVSSIYSKQLQCSTKNVEDLVYIADYLQAPCLLNPLLRYVDSAILPKAPAAVFNLGSIYSHLVVERPTSKSNITSRQISLRQAAVEEVLAQLAYCSAIHNSSTRFTGNDNAWKHTLLMMQELEPNDVMKLLSVVVRCSICPAQAFFLFMKWMQSGKPVERSQLESGKAVKKSQMEWVSRLCKIFHDTLSYREASFVIAVLNDSSFEPQLLDQPYVWLPLYKTLTAILLRKAKHSRSWSWHHRIIFWPIPVSEILGEPAVDHWMKSSERVPLKPGDRHEDQQYLQAEYHHWKDRSSTNNWGLYLKSSFQQSGTNSRHTRVFACLRASMWTFDVCGIKGSPDGPDWLPNKGDGLLSRWAKDPTLRHVVDGEECILVVARIYDGTELND